MDSGKTYKSKKKKALQQTAVASGMFVTYTAATLSNINHHYDGGNDSPLALLFVPATDSMKG